MMSLAARHAAIARPMPIASRAHAKPSRASRVVVNAAGADRELWYPGAKAPKYLDGTMAGDYGAYRASHRAHRGEHRCASACASGKDTQRYLCPMVVGFAFAFATGETTRRAFGTDGWGMIVSTYRAR